MNGNLEETDALHAKNHADFPLPDDPKLAALLSYLLDEVLWLRLRCRSISERIDDTPELAPSAMSYDLEEIQGGLVAEGAAMATNWRDFYLPLDRSGLQ